VRRPAPTSSARPLLEVEDLHVWFDLADGGELHAVQGAGFTLERGERLGLVGESGCGKTTTALAVMGLLPPSASAAGRILLDGKDLLAGGEATIRPHRWVEIAIVFQGAMNALNPVRTIGSQIVEALELHGVARGAAARARVAELLESVGIPAERAARFPHELSGGMRQRAAIAMALSCNPKVLIADEPTTALDVMVQAQILELLDRLCREFGLALIMVTHDLPVVAQLCGSGVVMYAGRVVERGPVEELYHRPHHPYTRLLFAATPDLDDLEQPIVSIPGAPPRLDRPIEGCPFRPRCDRAFARCATETPRLRDVERGRASACHLDELVPA
jgi:peptide/nickel transport system ATP-binding protein